MAKKKSQKNIEVHTYKPIGRIKKFDFSGKEDARIVNVMAALEATEGWACLRQLMEMQIKLIDGQIITKIGLDKQKLLEADMDILRDRRNIYQTVIDMPRTTRKSKTRGDGMIASPLDPYASDAKEVLEMQDE